MTTDENSQDQDDDEMCQTTGWYTTTWRNKWLTANAESIEDMIASLRAAADELEEMRKAGVYLDDNGSVADDYALLVTHDHTVAKRFGMDTEPDDDDDTDDDEMDA